MDAITELTRINFPSLFLSVFMTLIGIKAVVSVLEWTVGKLGLETKWMREKREERELLLQTSRNLTALQTQHLQDTAESNLHDEHLSDTLSAFMKDMSQSIAETQSQINRIVERNLSEDRQIDNLMIAQREVLADKINEKYKLYISINGIPEDELEEFTNLHTAYKGVGGNHSGDAKYEYCMRHLRVIPVANKWLMPNQDTDKINQEKEQTL